MGGDEKGRQNYASHSFITRLAMLFGAMLCYAMLSYAARCIAYSIYLIFSGRRKKEGWKNLLPHSEGQKNAKIIKKPWIEHHRRCCWW